MTKQILTLIDFSDGTERLLQHTAELASASDSKCWLLHVAAPDPDFVGYDVGPQYIRDDRAHTLREEHRQLQAFKKQLEDQGIETEALLIQGEVHKSIESEIEKLDIDLVVLGSHGHSRLHDLLVGSVCEHLLRKGKVPLFVVPCRG